MTRSVRTLIACIVAPSAASFLTAIIGPFFGPAAVGSAWWSEFGRYFYLASLVSYPLSYTVGTLTFVVLKLLRRDSFMIYGFAGGLTGFLYGVVVAVLPGYGVDRIAARFLLALLGVSVATAFTLIRGRNPELNQSSTAQRP